MHIYALNQLLIVTLFIYASEYHFIIFIETDSYTLIFTYTYISSSEPAEIEYNEEYGIHI